MLEVGYLLTEENKLCSDYVSVAIDILKACKEAAKELNENFIMTKYVDDWPQGCYLANGVYFNQHDVGSSNNGARQICYPRGKGYFFIYFY